MGTNCRWELDRICGLVPARLFGELIADELSLVLSVCAQISLIEPIMDGSVGRCLSLALPQAGAAT
jgi:hypothetical protein